jgi:hypothetical protein
LVAIPGCPPRTTPLESARRARRTVAAFLRCGLLSFAALLFLILPNTEVNEGRDRADDLEQQQCGPFKLDLRDPCNLLPAMLIVHS